MTKKLPYLIISIALGLGCFLFGGRVRAASPIFYSGTCEFGIARRSFYDPVDFNFATQSFELPLLNDMGIIDSTAWGLPSAFANTTYTNVPMYVSVTSPDVIRNGGYIYFTFMVAYWQGDGINSISLANGRRGKAYLSSPGSLEYAIANGIDLGYTNFGTYVTNGNTELVNATPAATGNEVVHVTELNMPSGVNFPKVAIFDLDDDKGTLNAYGLDDAYFLGYGETAENTWIKNTVWTFRLTVTPRTAISNNYTVYFDLSNCIQGSFTPVSFNDYNLQTNAGIYFIQSTLSGSRSNLIYMCPVSCFAISESSYLEIEQYLANIDNKLSALAGSNGDYPQSVLESYAALGSEAREAAASAAAAMEQAFPTYDPSEMDVSNLIAPQAKAQFKSLMGFLSHQKILPIIGAVFTLCLIAFVFFGKKS